MRDLRARWIAIVVALCAASAAAGQAAAAQAGAAQAGAAQAGGAQTNAPDAQAAQEQAGLVIENDSELPDAHPHDPYELRFRAHGNISTMHWRVRQGALPPGMKLEDDGRLHGKAEHAGEFQFAVSVTDSGRDREVQKGFALHITSALSLNWKAGAHVNGSRIEGSAEVTNTTGDPIDLTFVVYAVPPNGRAVAIGYQRFLLRRGEKAVELPFGESLPSGAYKVHVDAVGEVAPKKVIYREYLDTPGALQVTAGTEK
jgi:hypothetical protein